MTRTRPTPAIPHVLPCLAVLILLVAPAGLTAQSAERELYVSVLDGEGRPVTDLSPEAFIVREDGVRREVLRVSRATRPMQIAVLVDTSQAARRPMQEMREALADFIGQMHRGNEIALITFGDRPTILADYTSSSSTLEAAVGRLFAMPGSGAYFIDAMAQTLRGMRARDAARPVILSITTDGIDYSNVYYRSVLDDLRESGVAFHAIIVESDRTSSFVDQAARDRTFLIDEGTRITGGRREELLTSMALPDTLRALAEDLSNQYLLVYARPATLIPPTRVEVSAADAALEARGTPVREGAGS